jgi:hypothetical protein
MVETLAGFRAYVRFQSTDPQQNRLRFYDLRWQPTLFGDGALVRVWGRKGSLAPSGPPSIPTVTTPTPPFAHSSAGGWRTAIRCSPDTEILQRLLSLFVPQWLAPAPAGHRRSTLSVACPHCGMHFAGTPWA